MYVLYINIGCGTFALSLYVSIELLVLLILVTQ